MKDWDDDWPVMDPENLPGAGEDGYWVGKDRSNTIPEATYTIPKKDIPIPGKVDSNPKPKTIPKR